MLLRLENCFLPATVAAAAPVHASWFYWSLPLFSFEFHTFIHCGIGDNLCCAHYGFTRENAELCSRVTLFFAWNVAQHDQKARSKMKCSNTPWLSDILTFKLIKEARNLTTEQSVFSVMAKLIIEILFMLFSIIMLNNGLKMSGYEVYWLTGFPIINNWVCTRKLLTFKPA